MAVNRQSNSPIKRTTQNTQNWGFDEEYQIPFVGIAVENSAGTAMLRLNKDSLGVQSGSDYDYLDVQQTDSTTETYVYKTGGSGGTTVRTMVINYVDSSKDDVDNISWT